MRGYGKTYGDRLISGRTLTGNCGDDFAIIHARRPSPQRGAIIKYTCTPPAVDSMMVWSPAESASPMIEDTSATLITALQKPAAYPHPVRAVRLGEAQISWVLLTGAYAYKIKQPVQFGFLDISTLALRRQCCEEELRLNRRLAPELYLAVMPIRGPA